MTKKNLAIHAIHEGINPNSSSQALKISMPTYLFIKEYLNSESCFGQNLSNPSISKLGPSELYLKEPDRRLGGASESELLLKVDLVKPN